MLRYIIENGLAAIIGESALRDKSWAGFLDTLKKESGLSPEEIAKIEAEIEQRYKDAVEQGRPAAAMLRNLGGRLTEMVAELVTPHPDEKPK